MEKKESFERPLEHFVDIASEEIFLNFSLLIKAFVFMLIGLLMGLLVWSYLIYFLSQRLLLMGFDFFTVWFWLVLANFAIVFVCLSFSYKKTRSLTFLNTKRYLKHGGVNAFKFLAYENIFLFMQESLKKAVIVSKLVIPFSVGYFIFRHKNASESPVERVSRGNLGSNILQMLLWILLATIKKT